MSDKETSTLQSYIDVSILPSRSQLVDLEHV